MTDVKEQTITREKEYWLDYVNNALDIVEKGATVDPTVVAERNAEGQFIFIRVDTNGNIDPGAVGGYIPIDERIFVEVIANRLKGKIARLKQGGIEMGAEKLIAIVNERRAHGERLDMEIEDRLKGVTYYYETRPDISIQDIWAIGRRQKATIGVPKIFDQGLQDWERDPLASEMGGKK